MISLWKSLCRSWLWILYRRRYCVFNWGLKILFFMAFKRKRKMLNIELQNQRKGEVSQAQIDNWKEKHGEVLTYEVGDSSVFYLHRPDRKIVKLALSKAANDPLEMARVLITNCWLSGDESLKEDTGLHFSLISELNQIIGVKTLQLKNS
jgi:hypothetical protein